MEKHLRIQKVRLANGNTFFEIQRRCSFLWWVWWTNAGGYGDNARYSSMNEATENIYKYE